MKKHILEFLKRGLVAAAGGPIILAIIYLILGANGVIDSLSPFEVGKGILTATLMAFIAAGISMIYQVEQLPLPMAIGIHLVVLYLDYILIYLVNGWLKQQLIPILIFTAAFVLGFALIWLCVWLIIRKTTGDLNAKLPK